MKVTQLFRLWPISFLGKKITQIPLDMKMLFLGSFLHNAYNLINKKAFGLDSESEKAKKVSFAPQTHSKLMNEKVNVEFSKSILRLHFLSRTQIPELKRTEQTLVRVS